MALIKIYHQPPEQPGLPSDYFMCGGTLISDQWILTATHCIKKKPGLEIRKIEVILGEFNRIEDDDSEVHREVLQYYPHPGYNSITNVNDIALLKLNEKVDFNDYDDHLEPICMPTSGLKIYGGSCMATGWGGINQVNTSNTLQQVNLPIVSDENCRKVWGPGFDSQLQLCAGYKSAGRSTFKGDSGGPLNCQIGTQAWVLQGITSYGKSEAAPAESPPVFTKVAPYMRWIEEITGLEFPLQSY